MVITRVYHYVAREFAEFRLFPVHGPGVHTLPPIPLTFSSYVGSPARAIAGHRNVSSCVLCTLRVRLVYLLEKYRCSAICYRGSYTILGPVSAASVFPPRSRRGLGVLQLFKASSSKLAIRPADVSLLLRQPFSSSSLSPCCLVPSASLFPSRLILFAAFRLCRCRIHDRSASAIAV